MLEIIAAVLLVLWLGGFALNVAGNLIHILLVIAVIVFAMRFIRRTV
ncbi:MAG: lmo0937 family membrane protein [bacterium]|nr:lmo0937 family membrane protein [bacterium]